MACRFGQLEEWDLLEQELELEHPEELDELLEHDPRELELEQLLEELLEELLELEELEQLLEELEHSEELEELEHDPEELLELPDELDPEDPESPPLLELVPELEHPVPVPVLDPVEQSSEGCLQLRTSDHAQVCASLVASLQGSVSHPLLAPAHGFSKE